MTTPDSGIRRRHRTTPAMPCIRNRSPDKGSRAENSNPILSVSENHLEARPARGRAQYATTLGGVVLVKKSGNVAMKLLPLPVSLGLMMPAFVPPAVSVVPSAPMAR